MMETTLSVRLDQRLRDEAEITLERLGLSLSGAVEAFLANVVRQQRLPFQVQVQPVASDARNDTPPEVQAEILLELIGAVTAKLARSEAAETSAAKRAKLAQVRKALLAKRFEFDPHRPDQVRALMQEFTAHANALAGAGAAAIAPGS